MSDNVILGVNDDTDFTDSHESRTLTDFTQVASCAVGEPPVERRRLTLRAKLEREKFERQRELEKTFSKSFRNLLKGF